MGVNVVDLSGEPSLALEESRPPRDVTFLHRPAIFGLMGKRQGHPRAQDDAGPQSSHHDQDSWGPISLLQHSSLWLPSVGTFDSPHDIKGWSVSLARCVPRVP